MGDVSTGIERGRKQEAEGRMDWKVEMGEIDREVCVCGGADSSSLLVWHQDFTVCGFHICKSCIATAAVSCVSVNFKGNGPVSIHKWHWFNITDLNVTPD